MRSTAFPFYFELLDKAHDRNAFTCGNEPLDSYLKTQSSQDYKKHLAAVFVCTENGKTIAGYYTLSQCSVQLDHIPPSIAHKLTRQKMVPATLIGRLAVDISFQKKGIGEMILMDALHRSFDSSSQVASWAVIVDAKDDKAIAFYKKYGFLPFQTRQDRLFLPMGTISRLFE